MLSNHFVPPGQHFLLGSLGSRLIFANVMLTKTSKGGSVPFPEETLN